MSDFFPSFVERPSNSIEKDDLKNNFHIHLYIVLMTIHFGLQNKVTLHHRRIAMRERCRDMGDYISRRKKEDYYIIGKGLYRAQDAF